MKTKYFKLILLCFCILIYSGLSAQNLEVEGRSDLLGGALENPLRIFSTGTSNYTSVYNSGGYKGYYGVFNGLNDMDFGTGSSNVTGKVHLVTMAIPKLTILGGGDVGIGTTDPLSKLHIANDSGPDMIRLTSSNIDAGISFYQNNGTATSDRALMMLQTGRLRIASEIDGHDIDFWTNIAGSGLGSSKLTIKDDGNIGIGTTNPQQKLHITTGQIRIERTGQDRYTEYYEGGVLEGRIGQSFNNAIEIRNEIGADINIRTGGNLVFQGANVSGGIARLPLLTRMGGNTDGAAWRLGVTGQSIFRGLASFTDFRVQIVQPNFTITDDNNGLQLATSSSTKWRIMHTGANFSFVLDDDRKSYIEPDGDYVIDSDRRLKKDIQLMPRSLEKVVQLEPVTYAYKTSSTGKTHIGLIAQDVMELFPSVVTKGENDFYGVSYDQVGVIAIQAIKEQQAIINELKEQLEQVKTQLDALTKD